MKHVAKCSAFISFSYQVHVKVCIPIPLNKTMYIVNKGFALVLGRGL